VTVRLGSLHKHALLLRLSLEIVLFSVFLFMGRSVFLLLALQDVVNAQLLDGGVSCRGLVYSSMCG
jgi:hypothetical protein